MNTSFNKANVSVVGPWLTVLFPEIADKLGWSFTAGWYAALASLIVWGLAYAIPNKEAPALVPLKCVVLLPLALMALVALSGCSMVPYYNEVKAIAHQSVETAIQDRKNFNDLKTEAVLALPCDVSLGSAMRIEDQRKKAILIELCGGPPANSQITIDDMAKLMSAAGQP